MGDSDVDGMEGKRKGMVGKEERDSDGPFELCDVVMLCTDKNDAADAGVTLAGTEKVLVAGEHKVREALAAVGVVVFVTACTGAGCEGGVCAR